MFFQGSYYDLFTEYAFLYDSNETAIVSMDRIKAMKN